MTTPPSDQPLEPTSTEQPPSAEQPVTGQQDSAEQQEPAEQPLAAEQPVAAEQPDSPEQPEPADQPAPGQQDSAQEPPEAQPASPEHPAASEQPESPESLEQSETAEQPAPTAQPASAEQPAPTEQPAASERPESLEQPEPADQPAQAGHPAPTEQPVPAAPARTPGPAEVAAATHAPAPTPGPAQPPAASGKSDAAAWGRVGDDGTVYVRTPEGERPVGQMPDATPEEALAFFTKRYDDLAFEVGLLEQRVQAGTVGPDEAAAAVKQVRATLAEAQAVGDLAGLATRLDSLTGTINSLRDRKRKERAARLEAARGEKERIAGEAERLAESQDWRNGANRLRDLLEEWKGLPRLEKSVDDSLWRRFSTARTTYTRRRKAHFGELNEKREAARVIKERLVKEAEEVAGSTDWGPTAGRYRDLMRQWKAAGPAPRGVDDQLWKRFRAAQDQFFGARDAANAELDQEYAANAEKKEALLAEAEALLPVTDLHAAKQAFRDIAERWDAAGKVPRDRMKELESRIRKVEQAIRGVEDDQWRRSNPEARARAADTVAQLEASIAELETKREKALAAGNERKAGEHAAALEARRSWLAEAQKALDDFS